MDRDTGRNPRDKEKDPRAVRIKWARTMTNEQICEFLQGKLLEARATRETTAPVLLELVHEIKHRLTVTHYEVRPERDDEG